MLIDGKDEHYFIDRDNCVYKISGLSFLHRKEKRPIEDTVIDGEMVIDTVNGENVPRFLIYDIVRYEGFLHLWVGGWCRRGSKSPFFFFFEAFPYPY